MQFDWPTPDQMIYRVTRLRRLVALAVAIPVFVFLAGSLLDPLFMAPDRATLASLAVALLVGGHVVLFPNQPVETISLSLVVTGLAIAAPWIKALSLLVPPDHANAALVMLVALAVLAAGGLMAVLQFVFDMAIMAGPAIRMRLRASINVPCSAAVARNQFALQPGTRRGRIATSQPDANGFFDVAIIAPQVSDPDDPSQPMIAHVMAKTLAVTADEQQTMLVVPGGGVTVTSETFVPTPSGCNVRISELPGDFTLGMHAMFWLTDQQMDNLTETADLINGVQTRANGLAHGVSFLSIAGAILSPRPPVVDGAD